MKLKTILGSFILGTLVLGSSAVQAGEGQLNRGLYFGAGLGGSFFDVDSGDILGTSPVDGVSIDDSDIAWGLFAGWRLCDYLAIEGGWMDIGEYSADGFLGGSSPRGGGSAVSADTEVDGFNLRILAGMPVMGELLNVFGTGGAFFYRTDELGIGEIDVQRSRSHKTGTAFSLGAGIESHPIPAIGVRLGYEHIFPFDTKSGDVSADLIMASVIFGPVWGAH